MKIPTPRPAYPPTVSDAARAVLKAIGPNRPSWMVRELQALEDALAAQDGQAATIRRHFRGG